MVSLDPVHPVQKQAFQPPTRIKSESYLSITPLKSADQPDMQLASGGLEGDVSHLAYAIRKGEDAGSLGIKL